MSASETLKYEVSDYIAVFPMQLILLLFKVLSFLTFQPYNEVQYILTPVTAGADTYFDINDSGEITVIRNLVGSGTDTYVVSLFLG